MPQLILLIGPIGSGKTTYRNENCKNYTLVSFDEQGKRLKDNFNKAIEDKENIIVDMQNFSVERREVFTKPARENGYSIKFVQFNISKKVCKERVKQRVEHPTINDKTDIDKILNIYFSKFESPQEGEYDELEIVGDEFFFNDSDLTNLKGRILITSDIHGMYDEFNELLKISKPDYVICAGDAIDRGPNSIGVLDMFLTKKNFFLCEGNHDNKFKRYLRGNKVNISHGLETTIEEVNKRSQDYKNNLLEYLNNLPIFIRLSYNIIIVHAGFDLKKPLSTQDYETCLYIRNVGGKDFNDPNYPSWFEIEPISYWNDKEIFFGHMFHSKINVKENIFSLDGHGVFGDNLRGIVLNTEDNSRETFLVKCNKYCEEIIGQI